MKHKVGEHFSNDRGAAMVLIGFMMIFLLGISAFAVDLGWFLVNASRVQRTADAAALAGVTHLPTDAAGAVVSAENAASANGLAVGGDTSMATAVVGTNRFKVDVTTTVPTYFLRVFGQQTVTIRRSSTAEYVQPVPLGSPFNTFGDGDLGSLEFWAAIQGQYTNRGHGDPFATNCNISASDNDSSCESDNPTYRSEGYYMGVEVQPGTSDLDVDIYDAGFYQRSNFEDGTGDWAFLTGSEGDVISTIHYQLYEADTTPYDPSDNAALSGCYLELDGEQAAGAYRDRWAQLCSLTNPDPGIYVLRIWTSGPGGESNHFGIRAETAPGNPPARVYGLNDMSIFANVNAGSTSLYLAEVEEAHAGKTLVVSFFDAGDSNGSARVAILKPDGNVASCTWEATDDIAGSVTDSGSGICRIQTTSSSGDRYYDSQWITMEIDIPSSYTCGSSCWWRVRYEYDAQAHDRTTWTARVIGNPVRLVVGGA